MRAWVGLLLVSMSLWVGCDGGVAPIDAGTAEADDAGMDGGPLDARSLDDARASEDAGSFDAGSFDAGSFDAASFDAASFDAGSFDAGSFDVGSFDTGSFDAASFDAASFDATSFVFDASAFDASSLDGGRDAASTIDSATDAAATTCAVFASPAMGSTADTFSVTLVSNGASCTLRVDGVSLVVPCSITAEVAAGTFGVGTHTLELLVGSGPAGPAMCSTTVTVTAGPDAGPNDAGPAVTTCSLSIAPASATSDDELTLEAASNGSGCEIAVDGGARMSVPCTFTYASRLPAGDHVVVLFVGAGPAGATSCMASVTVVDAPDAGPRDAGPPGTTTCTIDVSPETGPLAGTFTLVWASSGSSCSLRLDGGPPLVVPCATTTTTSGSTFGAGAHTIELVVSAGPGGATSCADTVTVTP